MLAVLKNPSYARLFSAQVIALIGTGLLTVALGLLAFNIAGGNAGIVLGTALMIKMVAYVAVSPVMAALTASLPRKHVLIAADIVRALVAVGLPFVTETWHIYVLIFVLQAASATFTPTFQAVIPEILPAERDYTCALSLSRLAYDLEVVLSPMLAAALLTVIPFNDLFIGTVVGFVGSGLLVALTTFPPMAASDAAPFIDRLTRGARVFVRSAELRALLAINVVVAACGSFVIVNTVVLVQSYLSRPEQDVAVLLAAYGLGSMVVALLLPRALGAVSDRPIMLAGSALLSLTTLAVSATLSASPAELSWTRLLVLWAILGAATSAVLTPSARLLRRGSTESNRPAVFAAQFALSHACFLVTYPLAGNLGARIGLSSTAAILGGIAVVAAVIAIVVWRPAATAPAGPSPGRGRRSAAATGKSSESRAAHPA